MYYTTTTSTALFLCVQDLLAEEEEEEQESEFENIEQESEELEPDLAIELMDGIEHTDSYHLQLQRSKEETIKVVDAEDSLASLTYNQDTNKQLEIQDTNDDVEQKFNQILAEQTKLEQPDDANNYEDTGNDKRSASPESITGKEEEEMESVHAEMLVVERSTASDIVNQAMARAVERTATPV